MEATHNPTQCDPSSASPPPIARADREGASGICRIFALARRPTPRDGGGVGPVVAIVGGRDFSDYALLASKADELRPSRVVSGGARGADSLAAAYARERGLPLTELLPDWQRLKRRAGLVRNVDIVERAEVVLAFWDGRSTGTAHTIRTARDKRKRCIVVRYPPSDA